MDLQIRNIDDDLIKEIDFLKNKFNIATATKVAEHCILNFWKVREEMFDRENEIIQLKHELNRYKESLQNIKDSFKYIQDTDFSDRYAPSYQKHLRKNE